MNKIFIKNAPAQSHRKSAIQNQDVNRLLVELVVNQRVVTTPVKARKLSSLTTMLVRTAKHDSPVSRNKVNAVFKDDNLTRIFVTEIAPSLASGRRQVTLGRIPRKPKNVVLVKLLARDDQSELTIATAPKIPMKQAPVLAEAEPFSPARPQGHQVLATIDHARTRKNLSLIGDILDIPVRADRSSDQWTLGLGILRDDDEQPALLRLVKGPRGEGMQIELAWKGEQLPPELISEVAERVLKVQHELGHS